MRFARPGSRTTGTLLLLSGLAVAALPIWYGTAAVGGGAGTGRRLSDRELESYVGTICAENGLSGTDCQEKTANCDRTKNNPCAPISQACQNNFGMGICGKFTNEPNERCLVNLAGSGLNCSCTNYDDPIRCAKAWTGNPLPGGGCSSGYPNDVCKNWTYCGDYAYDCSSKKN